MHLGRVLKFSILLHSVWVQTFICVKDCGLNLLLWDEAVHLEGLPTVGTAELWVGARLWGQQSHLSAPQSTGHP